MVEKLFFHLFDLVIINAHILHNKTSKKKMSLEIFYKKFAERLLASAGTEIQVQGQTNSPAGRLVGRDHFLYVVGPKRNQKRSLVGGPIVVHASATRCLLQGPFCISLLTGII